MEVVQMGRTKLISEAVASYPRPTLREIRGARVANKLTRRLARERFEVRRKGTRRWMREHPSEVNQLILRG